MNRSWDNDIEQIYESFQGIVALKLSVFSIVSSYILNLITMVVNLDANFLLLPHCLKEHPE